MRGTTTSLRFLLRAGRHGSATNGSGQCEVSYMQMYTTYRNQIRHKLHGNKTKGEIFYWEAISIEYEIM